MASVTYEQAGGAPDGATPPQSGSVSYDQASDAGGEGTAGAVGYGVLKGVPLGRTIAEAGTVGAGKVLSALPDWMLNEDQRKAIAGLPTSMGQARTRMEATGQRAEAEHPLLTTGAELASGAATIPMAPAAKIAGYLGGAAPGVLARTAGAGVYGGILGGLYGGEQGSPGWGAMYGAAGGLIGEPVISGLGGVGQWAGRKFFADPESEAMRRVSGAIQSDVARGRGALSPQEMTQAQAAGQPAMLADVGGERTRALMRAAANVSPEARDALTSAVSDRFQSQGPRFRQFLQRSDMFGPDLDAQVARDTLNAERKASTGPAYDQAYVQGGTMPMTPTLRRLLQSPDVQAAIPAAQTKAANWSVLNNAPMPKNPFAVGPDGTWGLAQDAAGNRMIPNLQWWDQIKRSLQDRESGALRRGDNEDARDVGNVKRMLLGELDNLVPSYAGARQNAMEAFGASNALQAGEKFLGMNDRASIDAQKAALGSMSQPDREMFARGLASQIDQKAQNMSERRNIVSLFNSPATAEKMQLGLGPQRANATEAYLRREQAMDMVRTALGNSTTARQLYEMGGEGGEGGGWGAVIGEHIGEHVAGHAGAMFGLGVPVILKHMLSKAASGVNEAVMQRVGEQLTSRDPNQVHAALSYVARTPPLMDALRRTEGLLSQQFAFQGAAPR